MCTKLHTTVSKVFKLMCTQFSSLYETFMKLTYICHKTDFNNFFKLMLSNHSAIPLKIKNEPEKKSIYQLVDTFVNPG